MNEYEKRNRLALRAGEVLGSEEAEALMDGLSTGDRLEVELIRFRAEIDQKFASIDRAILESERRISEGLSRELKATRRFVAATSISVASVSLGVMIPMFVAVLVRT